MVEVKQFGLQRTGTNYLRCLLTKNYKVRLLVNRGGWKHGSYRVPEKLGRETHCVVNFMHPVPWLANAYRASDLIFRTAPKDFPSLVRETRAIDLWNIRNKHWLSLQLQDHKVVYVKYENLLENPQEVCRSIAQELGFGRKSRSFTIPTKTVDPKDTGRGFDASYYTEHKYLQEYTPGLIEYVRSKVDTELMRKLGYEMGTCRQMLEEQTKGKYLTCPLCGRVLILFNKYQAEDGLREMFWCSECNIIVYNIS